jgi:hypothetical protein
MLFDSNRISLIHIRGHPDGINPYVRGGGVGPPALVPNLMHKCYIIRPLNS